MAITKLGKVDLLVFICIALAVVLTLRVGVKLTRVVKTGTENATNDCGANGSWTLTTGRKNNWYTSGYGDDGSDDGPGYPFFFWYSGKLDSTTVLTAQKALEKELKKYADMLANMPSIVSKEVQRENDIVIYSLHGPSRTTQVNFSFSF